MCRAGRQSGEGGGVSVARRCVGYVSVSSQHAFARGDPNSTSAPAPLCEGAGAVSYFAVTTRRGRKRVREVPIFFVSLGFFRMGSCPTTRADTVILSKSRRQTKSVVGARYSSAVSTRVTLCRKVMPQKKTCEQENNRIVCTAHFLQSRLL